MSKQEEIRKFDLAHDRAQSAASSLSECADALGDLVELLAVAPKLRDRVYDLHETVNGLKNNLDRWRRMSRGETELPPLHL